MARYIDVDELLGTERLLDTDIMRKSKTASWLYDQIMYDITHTPTADVVPMAEVEKWQAIAEGYQYMFEDSYRRHQAELAKVRAEIAREIFADLAQYAICEQLYMGGVCLTEQEFDELKKKYGVE